MMEISNNMDVKKLPTENDLKRRISEELDDEEDKISAVRKVSVDSQESKSDKEILNGLDSSELDTELEKKTPGDCIEADVVAKERDAGTDLDALLYKISAIVDCDSKESIDESKRKSSEASDEQAGDGISEKVENNPTIADTDQKVLSTESEQNEEQTETSLEGHKEVDSVEAEEKEEKVEKTLEETESEENTNNCENGETDNLPVHNLNTSTDEVFMDALENISSSDEFDAFTDKKPETPKDSKPTKHNNNLEDITSDESEHTENSKADLSIIDLDSSNEVLENDTTTKQPVEDVKDAAEELQKENLSKTPTNENDTEDKEMSVESPVLSKDAEVKEADMEDSIKDELEAADETIKTNSKEDKMDTEDNIDESEKMDTEENIDGSEIKENGLVILDKEDVVAETAKLNGNSEKEIERVEEDVEGSEEQTQKKSVEPKAPKEKEADSDDEVIFFEPIKKSAKDGEEVESEKEVVKDLPSEENNTTDKKDDDEVVLVSEDEDDEPTAKTLEEETRKISENETTSTTKDSKSDSDMLTDNSDNACDQFAKMKAQEKRKSSACDEANSNSSNLLQPAQKKKDETTAEAKEKPEPEPQAQTESTAELDDGDVEIVAEKTDDEQDSCLPATKRIRLSTDEKLDASNSSSCNTAITSTNDQEAQPAVAKRSYNSLASPTKETVQKEETPNKKIKRDDNDSNSSNDGNLQIDMDVHDTTPESKPAAITEPAKLKPVDEDSKELTIELKPKPELKSNVKPVRLDFVRNFRSSFDKMTRLDLEELVLQKVVEAMLVQSDFADLRRQVDKHEATLAIYRRKIAEVTKQFLDLETVHKRVLKDLETKNAHFTAPVRITRAVGLQVGMTLIKKPADDVRHGQVASHTAGSMSTSTSASTSTSTSPLKPGPPPLRPQVRSNMPRQAVGQQQALQQQHQQQRSALPSNIHPSSSGTPPVRRGCMQKVTPTRPVNNMPSSQQVSPNPPNLQRLLTSSGAVRPGYGSSAAASNVGQHGGAKPATSAAYAQQKHQQLQQQKQLQQQQQQQPLPVRIGRSPGKQPTSTAGKQRSMPIGGGTVSVPMNNETASGSGYGQPNLAPARPKEKAVIDLTDEDDAAAAAAAAAEARLRQQSGVWVKRSLQTAATSIVAGGTARPGASNAVRVSPMNMPRANAVSRQIVSSNSTGQRNSTGSSASTQSRSDNATPSHIRYMQPAPLPLAPPQTYHPEWKLPPSRPVIRINLHDSGIVISWTLEDVSQRFAECISYQIYAYQESINEPCSDSWRHVGDVKAMMLPMAVTLNQFQENQRYFFAVRGIDAHDRYGVFSLPKTW